jgi:hypothetical protein
MPELLKRRPRNRHGMKHHHIRIPTDPGRLVLDEKNIRRLIQKGIANELM